MIDALERAFRFALAALLWGCGGGIPPCAAGALEAALSTAGPGDVVEVGACRAEGRFRVPSGVTLRGDGPSVSVIASAGTAIELLGDATVEGLRIEHGAGHGIGSLGAASVTIRDVEIFSTLGRAAIGISDVASVSITDVTLAGPVTSESVAQMLPEQPTAMDTALHGLVLINVANASLERVDVTGYGTCGVASSSSTLSWVGGSASGNLGIGIWIDGGNAALQDVVVEETLRGFRGVTSYGLLSTRMASLQTQNMTVRRTHSGIGTLHDTGSVAHESLLAEGHSAGAVVAQRTTSMALVGGSRLLDNDFGGLLAAEAGGLVVDDVRIERTRQVRRLEGNWGNVQIGDGIQLASPPAGTTLRNLTLLGNERAGILLDLGGADTSAVTLTSVTVDADGSALGAVVQNGAQLSGWDAGIAREGAALVNDPTFAGGLEIIRVLDAASFPASDALVGVVTPCD